MLTESSIFPLAFDSCQPQKYVIKEETPNYNSFTDAISFHGAGTGCQALGNKSRKTTPAYEAPSLVSKTLSKWRVTANGTRTITCSHPGTDQEHWAEH